jgi:hypothetical protein
VPFVRRCRIYGGPSHRLTYQPRELGNYGSIYSRCSIPAVERQGSPDCAAQTYNAV